jgi:hypothetical protein
VRLKPFFYPGAFSPATGPPSSLFFSSVELLDLPRVPLFDDPQLYLEGRRELPRLGRELARQERNLFRPLVVSKPRARLFDVGIDEPPATLITRERLVRVLDL